jgi:hypothetical protein
MSRSFCTLTSAIAVAFALALVSPPTTAHATNTWDALGLPITGTTSSESGTSVATSSDGSIVAIGSPEILLGSAGRVKIYQLSSGTWTQLGADIVGATNGDYTGFSVALSSDGLTVAVGSPRADPGAIGNSGVVRVYSLQSGTWTQLGADTAGTSLSGQLGYSVAISSSGNRVAIGAPGVSTKGAVSVFDYTSGTNSWGQVGATLDAEASFDDFGTSVSLSDDGVWLAASAPKNDVGGAAANAGHARVYELVSTTWTQRGADIDGEVAGDLSGQSLALSANGQRLVIGSHRNDSGGVNAGRARVFDLTAGSWQLVGQALNGPAAGDDFGWAVDITAAGDQIAVGARTSDVPASEAGSVTAFTLVSGTWTQRGQAITGTAASEQAGYALALSSTGDRIVIGSPGRALPSVSTGEVRIFGFTATTSATVEPGPGRPGIYMHIAGPVGRAVEDSPIYVGSDRVAKSSDYTLMLRRVGGLFVTLAAGQVDARGNAEMRITLPTLAPGEYMVTFRGTHANGTGLKLTNYITVGPGGTYLVIEENQPGTW